jgi:alpha,alpha-trehalase
VLGDHYGLNGTHEQRMSDFPPLHEVAFVSDCHTGALLGPDGAVEWLCVPRFDGPSAFARLLDRERGGHLGLAVDGAGAPQRSYRPGTLVLDSRFEGPDGSVIVTDFLALERPVETEVPTIRPRRLLVRLARCERGRARLRIDVDSRSEYATRRARWWRQGGTLRLDNGPVWISISFGAERRPDGRITGEALLEEGERAVVVLGYAGTPAPVDADAAVELLEVTEGCWTAWSALTTYDGVAADHVSHGAAVLRGLMFDESGALLAAPTTSLPECPGGTRNWDYRYTWHRDAALHMLALLRLGHEWEARQYLDFLLHRAIQHGETLMPMAAIVGGDAPDEIELEHMDGYLGSRPVRVGNGANDQFQLDTYGHILDAAHGFHEVTGELAEEDWDVLRRVADGCCERWRDPDQGIWEVRGDPRHYTDSKVMAWVCLDRAVRLAGALGTDDEQVERWARERDAVRADVLERGWSEEVGAFVQSYGDTALDAALVRIPLVGFLAGDDPRVIATLERVIEVLGEGDALVHRYDHEATQDGFDEGEAPFLLCSFDLVSALVLAGRAEEARRRFDLLIGAIGPLRVLSEEMTSDGRMLGNHPQAFSHLSLLEAAFNLEAAGREEELHAWAVRAADGERCPPVR